MPDRRTGLSLLWTWELFDRGCLWETSDVMSRYELIDVLRTFTLECGLFCNLFVILVQYYVYNL